MSESGRPRRHPHLGRHRLLPVCHTSYIGMSAWLLYWHHGEWNTGIRNIVLVLFFLGFVYTPLISYVTARLEGMVGQVVEIPMIREAALILSGYQGVACWFLPLPDGELRADDRLLPSVRTDRNQVLQYLEGQCLPLSHHPDQLDLLHELHLGIG
jgi:hypothetical protein